MGQVGSRNWVKKEYIIERTGEYLREINPAQRRITICDAEQLVATGIVIARADAGEVLLLVADNRNALAWTKKGYSKKGAAWCLNRETSNRIAMGDLHVEGFYRRCGNNLIPDWATRTPKSDSNEWEKANGYGRIRLRLIWAKLMDCAKPIEMKEITMSMNRRVVRPVGRLFLDWGSSGRSFAASAREFGMAVQFAQAPRDMISNLFCRNCQLQPYAGEPVYLMGASVRKEDESIHLHREVRRIDPGVAVLKGPVVVGLKTNDWGAISISDSAQFWDDMGSLWQIGGMGRSRLQMFQGPATNPYGKTIGARYMECGLLEVGGERGIINHRVLQHSNGLDVMTTYSHGMSRLSVNSCVGLLSLEKVRSRAPKWPSVGDYDGNCREIPLKEQYVSMRNMAWRNTFLMPNKISVGAVWRPTPSAVWNEVVGGNLSRFRFNSSCPIY